MDTDTIVRIKNQITQNPVMLYIKGTPTFPMCGFSSKVVQILQNLQVKFAYANVLENPDIRAELPKYSAWPTFPQLYVNGELIGGCDIVVKLNNDNELQQILTAANAIQEKTESYSVA